MTVPTALDTRFRDAAAAEGLLDVAYDLVDTPVGQLLVAVTDHGVCEISYDPEPEREEEQLARAFGVRVLRSAKPTDEARRQLDEYFAGKRTDFDLPLDLRQARDFGRAVLDELARVPYGELTTYGTLAARAGRPRAARAVGTVMNRNPVPIVLPCHRVVGSTGSLVGYARRPRPQAHAARAGRLAAEGLTRARAAVMTVANHPRRQTMKRLVLAAILALMLVPAAPAAAAGPTLKSLQAQITTLKKQVKTLQKQVKADRSFSLASLAYSGCSFAVTADALQGTWTALDARFVSEGARSALRRADPGRRLRRLPGVLDRPGQESEPSDRRGLSGAAERLQVAGSSSTGSSRARASSRSDGCTRISSIPPGPNPSKAESSSWVGR